MLMTLHTRAPFVLYSRQWYRLLTQCNDLGEYPLYLACKIGNFTFRVEMLLSENINMVTILLKLAIKVKESIEKAQSSVW